MLDHKPDIAVIMSVYKNDKLDYLKSAVESILNQTYRNFVFFIALDGPIAEECDKYLLNLTDSRVKIYPLEKNQGLAVALNYLLKIILPNPQFKFIARMDADDIAELERLNMQKKYFEQNNNLNCAGSWAKVINENGLVISYLTPPREHESIKKYYKYRSPLIHSSVMFTSCFFKKVGYYPENTVLMEDTYLWGKAFIKELRFGNLDKLLLNFRIDKSFYIRRSGVMYGFNYILTRFKINKLMQFSFDTYLFSFIIGLIKMLPSMIGRYIYSIYFYFKKLQAKYAI